MCRIAPFLAALGLLAAASAPAQTALPPEAATTSAGDIPQRAYCQPLAAPAWS